MVIRHGKPPTAPLNNSCVGRGRGCRDVVACAEKNASRRHARRPLPNRCCDVIGGVIAVVVGCGSRLCHSRVIAASHGVVSQLASIRAVWSIVVCVRTDSNQDGSIMTAKRARDRAPRKQHERTTIENHTKMMTERRAVTTPIQVEEGRLLSSSSSSFASSCPCLSPYY